VLEALLVVPTLAGLGAFFVRSDEIRRGLLVLTALIHTVLVIGSWALRPAPAWGGWLALDGPGLLVLGITSVLFLAAAIYAVGYLRHESPGVREDFFEEKVLFTNEPEAVFTGCLLLFLAAMTLVALSQHIGLLWVAVEATTLASAPLIYFHRHHRSLEATWKYLVICSVGIALALLGNFLLAVAATGGAGESIPLVLGELIRAGSQLNLPWLKAAFLFLFIGYGTKMGLAPLHTWLPDAHSEAPSVVSALLSGALLNCAFLGIVRVAQVCVAAGVGAFTQEIFLWFGMLSMAVAAIFIVGQADYKRMLAYSSVEHMGIVAVGMGLGGVGIFGALLHMINHSFTKAMLFFAAGTLLRVYRTKSVASVRGVLRTLPISGTIWMAGVLAITGSPPFGPFLSKFTILMAALAQGQIAVAVIYLGIVALIFVGMVTSVLAMIQGVPSVQRDDRTRAEVLFAVVPSALLGLLVLILGLYVPSSLEGLLREAAQALGGDAWP
jgi:hydrogenase-4 component F